MRPRSVIQGRVPALILVGVMGNKCFHAMLNSTSNYSSVSVDIALIWEIISLESTITLFLYHISHPDRGSGREGWQWGGAGPKDGIFAPAPHGFFLPHPRPRPSRVTQAARGPGRAQPRQRAVQVARCWVACDLGRTLPGLRTT